jgi:hypothetical protein
MIGGPSDPAVKVSITVGSSQKPAVTFYCRFKPQAGSDTITIIVGWWLKPTVKYHCRLVAWTGSEIEPITVSVWLELAVLCAHSTKSSFLVPPSLSPSIPSTLIQGASFPTSRSLHHFHQNAHGRRSWILKDGHNLLAFKVRNRHPLL